MNNIFRITGLVLVIIFFDVLPSNTTLANESQIKTTHNEQSHEHEKPTKEATHEEGIYFSPEKIKLAGIKIEAALPKKHIAEIYAPGEVKVNGYKSYIVSPRTDSVVVKRHAILGSKVTTGQKLVTLFSEAMAQTHADFLTASSNWKRAKTLGSDNLSERTLFETENIYKGVYGKLIAFGLTKQAIDELSQQDSSTFGQYALVAEREGVVLQDNFMQGQRIEAGESLMLLADEKELWIDASIPPNIELNLEMGSTAQVDLNGTNYQAKVIQEAHTIDPVTRTRTVRLSVSNAEHKLHSGMFIKVYFQLESNNELIAVPEEALIRNSDGDWVIFIEDHPHEFKVLEVTRGRSFGKYREVLGVKAGSRVVTNGAFFIASEIAKGGFAPHNH